MATANVIDLIPAPRPAGAVRTSLAGTLATGQGLFYLVTGVWPLVHIDSFQAVTGPKADLWLVYTVGALVAVVGAVLLGAVRSGRLTPEIVLLAAGCAAALTCIDVVFVARGVIAPVYLLDAAVEIALVLGWAAAFRPGVRGR